MFRQKRFFLHYILGDSNIYFILSQHQLFEHKNAPSECQALFSISFFI